MCCLYARPDVRWSRKVRGLLTPSSSLVYCSFHCYQIYVSASVARNREALQESLFEAQAEPSAPFQRESERATAHLDVIRDGIEILNRDALGRAVLPAPSEGDQTRRLDVLEVGRLEEVLRVTCVSSRLQTGFKI